VEVLRTPEDRFAALPGFPYEPRYHDWDGVRLARVDVGEGPPVVLLHGQPTWSYLFRKTIPPLVEAGYRAVAPDLPGFGRSDKPDDEDWYSYDRHTDALRSLFEELDLRDVTLVMHDWGGPLGARLAGTELPDRITRLVAMDTFGLTGEQKMGEGWEWFRDMVAARDDFPVGRMIRLGAKTRPGKDVAAAYDAPFPDARSKAGVRAFPRLIPLSPDAPGADAGRAARDALQGDERPTLLLWAEDDPIFPFDDVGHQLGELFPAGGEPTVVEGSGHFLPEDRGELLGATVADWLGRRRS
jgi:haloalkane dehalogenase